MHSYLEACETPFIIYLLLSKEPSHLDVSFEYPQHMFWMRNKENRFPIRTLIWRPVRPLLLLLTQYKAPQLCMELSTTGLDTNQETSTLPLDHTVLLCKPIERQTYIVHVNQETSTIPLDHTVQLCKPIEGLGYIVHVNQETSTLPLDHTVPLCKPIECK